MWLRGACLVVGGVHGWGVCIGYDEIRSKSGRYASYWNAFLLFVKTKDLINKVLFVLQLCTEMNSGALSF